MRRYTVSAKYARFIEATLAIALAEAAADREYRGSKDPLIRGGAKVPDQLIDAGAQGDVEIIVGIVDEPVAAVQAAGREGRMILYGIPTDTETKVIPLPEPLKVAS